MIFNFYKNVIYNKMNNNCYKCFNTTWIKCYVCNVRNDIKQTDCLICKKNKSRITTVIISVKLIKNCFLYLNLGKALKILYSLIYLIINIDYC